MACQDVVARLDGPESVRIVAQRLCTAKRLTMKQLQQRSGLARRTVYGALRRLRELGLITETPNLRDTRQSWFSLRID